MGRPTARVAKGRSTQPREPANQERWTPSAGQQIDAVKWNLLRYIPVMGPGAGDDEEETTESFPRL